MAVIREGGMPAFMAKMKGMKEEKGESKKHEKGESKKKEKMEHKGKCK